MPRYAGHFALATSRNKLFLINDKGRVMHANKDIVKYLKTSGFEQAEKPLDAAVTTTLGSRNPSQKFQIFFKGDRYTLYKGFMKKFSGPHSIYDPSGPLKVAFPYYVRKINAAMTFRTKNSKVYFFFQHGTDNRGYYYRYDTRSQSFDAGYPKLVTQGFIDIPESGPEAAISSKRTGRTYFIAKDQIYKMDDRYSKVIYGYPKAIGSEFMRCVRPNENDSSRSKFGPLYFLQRLIYSLDTGKISDQHNVSTFRSVELDD